MPRKARELSALAVSRLVTPGLHFVGGVDGLALQVLPSGGRSWILRVSIAGKRRDMGLGGFPDVPLARAREAARDAREKIRAGIDPIEQTRAARSALAAERAAALTFQQCAEAYIKAHRSAWKNAKHAQQWENTLSAYAYPRIGRALVRDIGLPQVMAVLEQPADPDQSGGPSLWAAKTETAKRLRGRLEAVLDWAAVRGYRDKDNPARWRGNLDKLLAAPGRVAKVGNQPALPAHQAGAFMARLRGVPGMGARALEFAILTAARSSEVRGMLWSEVNLEGRLWTVPAERMKAGREHRVSLSEAAVRLLTELPRVSSKVPLVFPSSRADRPLSDMTLTACIRRLNEADGGRWIDPRSGRAVVPHGFRSTFRDWAAERTAHAGEVVEMALAHAIGNKVEAAYRRGDLLDKRRQLMEDWAGFLVVIEQPGIVVPIRRRTRRAGAK